MVFLFSASMRERIWLSKSAGSIPSSLRMTVAVSVCDASDPSRYYSIRGRVVKSTTEGGVEHIETLAQRYTGRPYAWYGGRDQVRVILTISADKIHVMAR